MTDIMKLATAYATSAQVDGRHDFDSSKTAKARAVLQEAIEVLTADRNQLQRDFTYMKQQRDTLRAQLEAMQRQEPEQAAFERWLSHTCPSGDVEEVQRKWEASSKFAEWQDASPKALEPLTDGQIESLVDVAYKHWQDKTTFDIGKVRSDFRSVPGIGSQQ